MEVKHKRIYATTAGLGLAAGLGGLAVTGAIASAPHTPVQYDLAIVQEGAGELSPGMTLPPEVDVSMLDGGRIVAESIRGVATSDGGQFFTAFNESGELCLIASVTGKDWAVGSTCSSPEKFHAHGLGMRVEAPVGSAEAYLVSDSAASALSGVRLGESASLAAPNLLVIDPVADDESRAVLEEQVAKVGVRLIPETQR